MIIMPKLAFLLINRTYRLIMVLLRGWPPAHMDADGDWRPATKVEEKTETATVGDMSHTVKKRTEAGAYNPRPTTRHPRPGDPDYIASIDG